MKRAVVERNMSSEYPPDQKWRVWLVDEYGDEWTMSFAPTRVLARKLAIKLRRQIRKGTI